MKQATTNYVKFAVAGTLVAFAAGCATQQGTNTAVGTGVGAALGAGIGALIGDGRGAAIGAGVGAVAGGIAGYNWSGVKKDVEQSGASSLGIDVVEMPDGSLKVNIPSNVSFDTGKAVLKPALLPVLDSVANSLVQHPELRLKAVGHTDSTGTDAINQPLSENRAKAVTSYVATRGVAAGRMAIEGRAARDPIADNNTAQGREQNRRVEVYLYAVQQ